MIEPLHKFPNGATRSTDSDDMRFDLIPQGALKRLARRYAKGAAVHGERNWEAGVPASVVINHLFLHLSRWLSGDRSDDHLAACAWGAFALMHYEEHRKEYIDTPTTPIHAAHAGPYNE